MQSTRPFILFFNSVRRAVSFNQQLQKIARTELVTSKSRDEFFSDLQGKYKDISVIYMTSASGAVSFLLYRNVNSQAKSKAKQLAGRFDVDLIHHHLQTCKHCHNGAGYNKIDVDACTKHGIAATYAPEPITEATQT